MTKLLTVGLALVMAVACHSNTASKATSAAAADTSVVQVYYFHGKQRCKTCNAVEQVAQQAIQANYAGNTKVVFTPVPMDEPANKALVEQYQVSFSSLIVAKGTR